MLQQLPLSEDFIRHWPGAAAEQRREDPSLEQQLRDAHAQGSTSWSEVRLEISHFVRYVAERTPTCPDPTPQLAALHTSDLYLTCACVHGIGSALASFDRAILARVPSFITKIDSSSAFSDEVTQRLRARFLCADPGTLPGIAQYSGAGALINWVRVAAVRAALGIRRNFNERPGVSVDEATLQAMPMGGTPELENIRHHCQRQFTAALTEAFATLSPQQRNVLRLHFAVGLTGEQIATKLSIGRATVVRWLARAREHLMRETRRLLRQRLGLGPAELDSFIHAALSQLDMSLSYLLRNQTED